jgi:hypothetical protein
MQTCLLVNPSVEQMSANHGRHKAANRPARYQTWLGWVVRSACLGDLVSVFIAAQALLPSSDKKGLSVIPDKQ